MKKTLKIIGTLIILLILSIGVYYVTTNEPLPEGAQGKEADELAEKMMSAINKRAFDSTEILTWSFRQKHHYIWKKQEGLVIVSWDDISITLNLNDHSKSIGSSPELIQTALDFFNNDSFWLVAPYKVFDEGVVTDGFGRKINFKNTIIIMTSNVGAKRVADFGTGIGFESQSSVATQKTHVESIIRKELKNKLMKIKQV